jgi:hypothetical protein
LSLVVLVVLVKPPALEVVALEDFVQAQGYL